MANVMSLRNLKNKVHRNGFDLSYKSAFTSKVGQLLPLSVIDCIPGDKFDIDLSWDTKTQPVVSSAYTRIREYYDFFFVPYRLLWRNYPTFIDQMRQSDFASSIVLDNFVGSRHPHFSFSQYISYINTLKDKELSAPASLQWKDIFGNSRRQLTATLMEYLGYGDATELSDFSSLDLEGNFYGNVLLNPFPLLAYQKIYQDIFRDSQWESAASYTFNVDYLKDSNVVMPIDKLVQQIKQGVDTVAPQYNMFDMRYCNWNKDYFTGLLPSAQYGSEAVATPLVGHGDVGVYNQDQTHIGLDFDGSYDPDLKPVEQNSIGLGVIALRKAECFQKWKEISLSGRKDYQSQVEKHWNVRLPDYYSNRCHYIGGVSGNVVINPVYNTSLDAVNPEPVIAGKGTGGNNGHIRFETEEHGILMCIYHALPLLDYSLSGINKFNLKTSVTDYAIPELDSIGMQTTDVFELSSPVSIYKMFGSNHDDFIDAQRRILGYAPRYAEYKTSVDKVFGAFRKSMHHWVAPMTSNYIEQYLQNKWNLSNDLSLNYVFQKVNPALLDPIFGVAADSTSDTDQFLINSFFSIKSVRNLDYDGLPY